MRELYIKISPIILNYSGAIIENGKVEKELTTIPAQPFDLANFILENNIDKVSLFGNTKYTTGVQSMLNNELNNITQYSILIPVELKEIDG